MKNIYVIKKYVTAESIEEALKKEKGVAPVDVYLTDYSTQQYLEALVPKKEVAGFNNKKEKDDSRP